MAPAKGPMSGTNSVRPAMSPSAIGEGTPIAHIPIATRMPTMSMATSCPPSQRRNATSTSPIVALICSCQPTGNSLTSPVR
jgi:hypothetical protein